jgi:hypothetical protein
MDAGRFPFTIGQRADVHPYYPTAIERVYPEPATRADPTRPTGQRTFLSSWAPKALALTPSPMPVRSRLQYAPVTYAHPYRHLPLNAGTRRFPMPYASVAGGSPKVSRGNPRVQDVRVDWKRPPTIIPGAVLPGGY